MKQFSPLILCLFILAGCNNNITVSQTDKPQIGNNLKALKTIPVGKTPHGIGQAAGFIYNSNIGDGTVSVIDTRTDTVAKTIKLGDGVPGFITSFHDEKNILITDTKKGELVIIDPAREHKILQTIPLGKGPDKIRVSEDDKTVFVSLTGEDKVIALTFDNDRNKVPVRKEIKAGSMTESSEHRSLAFSDGWVVVPNIADNDVSLININSGNEKRLKGGNNPAVVDIGMINDKAAGIVVGNTSSNTVTIFDIYSEISKTLSNVGLAPTDIVCVENSNRAFITMSGSDEVAVIDYNKKTLTGKIPVGKRPVHIYSVSNESGLTIKHEGKDDINPEIWVGNDAGDSVTVIDSETMAVKATIPVGKGHHKIAFTTDKAYVSNITDNTISVIERKTIN